MPQSQPISSEGIARAVALMRAIGTDTQRYEVKSARKELPRDVAQTISSFANGAGGTIICGLSEKAGFVPVEGFDARAVHDAMAQACNDKMTPPVRAEIAIVPFEGANLVVTRIDELSAAAKPCYVTASGKYHGSYIRTGDGDRRLSEYEVDRLLEEHRQPRFDNEVVPEATLDDFDKDLLNGLLARERYLHPRNFASLDDETAEQLLGVVKQDDAGRLRPTLAGLLALGTYPQRYFPRLNVSLAVYPGTSKADVTGTAGNRLLDSATLVGPIPYLLADASAAIARNMRTGARVEGAYRTDVPDYPPVALREALANALMHRDYSPLAQGTPVHVDMYADRIVVTSPGGLYGAMTIDRLGTEQGTSSRNEFLANILESTPAVGGGFVVENRGTGYRVIEAELAAAKMPLPVPRNAISFFSLTMERRIDPREQRPASARESVRAAVMGLLAEQGSVSSSEVARRCGVSKTTALKYINEMVAGGLIESTASGGGRSQRYRLS